MDADTSEIVVVTAPRLPEAPGDQVYSTLPIDQRALNDAIRLDQALTVAPGSALFRRNDSGAANPTVQGLSLRAIGPSGAGRALVTLDSVPQQDPFGGWVIWAALPPEDIAGANIVRGAGAGPYGAGALTGNVELAERAQPGYVFSAEGGERGYWRAAGLGEASDGNLDFLLGATAEHTDGWTPVRHGGAADVPLELDSVSGVARVQAQRGDVLISGRIAGYDETRASGLLGGASGDSGASESLTLVRAPGDDHGGWRVQGWARQSDMNNAFVSVAPDRSTTTPASLQYATPANGWGANAAYRWNSGEAGLDVRAADGQTHELFLFSGGAFTRSRIAGGRTIGAGAYLESWRDIGPLLLSGGVRLDYWKAYDGVRLERNVVTGAPTLEQHPNDNDSWAPTARFGAKRQFGDLYLRGALYSGFRPPTLNELHRPFRVGNDTTNPNPLLSPEKLYGIDAALGHDGRALAWSFGVFDTRLVDPITNVTLSSTPTATTRMRENTGHIDAQGVEAEAHGAWTNALDWRLAADYTHARVDGGDAAPQLDGLQPAQAPSWTITAGLAWRAWTGGELSADVRAESPRFEDDQNQRRLAATTSVDLRVSQDITERAQLYLALDNAFDDVIETGAAADGTISTAAPRALRVGFRLTGG